MISKWPENWHVANWKYFETIPVLFFYEWWIWWASPPGDLVLLFKGWCWVKSCWFDLGPLRSILRSSIGSNRWFDLSDVVVAGRVDFVIGRMLPFAFWAKRCRNGLEFEVALFSSILRSTVCSILWNKISSFTSVGSSILDAGKVKTNDVAMAQHHVCKTPPREFPFSVN